MNDSKAKGKQRGPIDPYVLTPTPTTRIVLSENQEQLHCRFVLVSNDEHKTVLQECKLKRIARGAFCRKHSEELKGERSCLCRHANCLRFAENRESRYCIDHNICMIEGCFAHRHRGRKYCWKHYSQKRRSPDALKTKTSIEQLMKDEEARLVLEANPLLKQFDDEYRVKSLEPFVFDRVEFRKHRINPEYNIFDRFVEEIEAEQMLEMQRKKPKT